MQRKKLFVLGATLLSIALLFAFSFNFLDRTGLFGLFAEKEKQPEIAKATEESNGIKVGLSLKLLQPTTIEASILKGKTLLECPKETEAEIELKNSGGSPAEKVFLEFGSGIRVIACDNCFLEEMKPGQEVKVKARLCLGSKAMQSLIVGSANSNSVELAFEN